MLLASFEWRPAKSYKYDPNVLNSIVADSKDKVAAIANKVGEQYYPYIENYRNLDMLNDSDRRAFNRAYARSKTAKLLSEDYLPSDTKAINNGMRVWNKGMNMSFLNKKAQQDRLLDSLLEGASNTGTYQRSADRQKTWDATSQRLNDVFSNTSAATEDLNQHRANTQRNIRNAKIGLGAIGLGAAGYGAYRLAKAKKENDEYYAERSRRMKEKKQTNSQFSYFSSPMMMPLPSEQEEKQRKLVRKNAVKHNTPKSLMYKRALRFER